MVVYSGDEDLETEMYRIVEGRVGCIGRVIVVLDMFDWT